MIGAILGDILGSTYEWRNTKTETFPLFPPETRFTDDTVMTIATSYALLQQKSYRETYQNFYHRYPNAGYGSRFSEWAQNKEANAYGSYGNGSAMRVSPVAYAFRTETEVLSEAERSAGVSHNHPEGIKGAKAIALATFYARNGKSKDFIKKEIEKRFGYNLQDSISNIRKTYHFDVSCQGSVPEAIISFLESTDYESAIRKAISLGGDSDTIACMCGSIASAYYGEIPDLILSKGISYLDSYLKEQVKQFAKQYPVLKNNSDLIKLLSK